MDSKLNLAKEASVGILEWGLLVVIVLVAGIYLWRKYFIKKGCAGCASRDGVDSCPLHLNPQDGGRASGSTSVSARQHSDQPLHYQENIPLQNVQTHTRKQT